jgi:outer membrane biosynthesis protein TonB
MVHGTAILVAWLTTMVRPQPLEFITYEIQLMEAPEEEFVLETPDPVSPPVEEPPEPEPDPIQEEPPPVQDEDPEPEVEEEPAPEEPDPAPPQRTGESIEARMEGLRKDYPEYYAEIQLQITRCFRWTGSGQGWEASVDFYIDADGGVAGRDIEISRPSGSLEFDLRVVEAVECAGRRLSPLPDEIPTERLLIRFNFDSGGSEPGEPVAVRPASVQPVSSASVPRARRSPS